MIVVGLTGGISCGKSTVCSLLKEYHIPVIDADQVAREVVLPGTEGLAEIVKHFGQEILSSDGTLDRKKLGGVVFGSDEKRKLLNSILHPKIAIESAKQIASLSDNSIVVYDAALLVENGLYKSLDGLIVVTAKEEIQLERLMARDHSSKEEALARIRAQLPMSDKVAVADFVIDNSGNIEELEAKVDNLFVGLVDLEEKSHDKNILAYFNFLSNKLFSGMGN